jgi:hypothetical protein
MFRATSLRLLLAALIALVAFPPLSLQTAVDVAAFGPECSDSNLPNWLAPAPASNASAAAVARASA